MEPNEEYEQIMQAADENIRRWRTNYGQNAKD